MANPRKKKRARLTLGRLRELTKDLPDSTLIFPDWAPGCIPGDLEPGVAIRDIVIEKLTDSGKPYVSIRVRHFYLRN